VAAPPLSSRSPKPKVLSLSLPSLPLPSGELSLLSTRLQPLIIISLSRPRPPKTRAPDSASHAPGLLLLSFSSLSHRELRLPARSQQIFPLQPATDPRSPSSAADAISPPPRLDSHAHLHRVFSGHGRQPPDLKKEKIENKPTT